MKLLAGCRLQNSLGENFRKGVDVWVSHPAAHPGRPLNLFEEEARAADPTWVQEGSTRMIPGHLLCARHSAKHVAHTILLNPQKHLVKQRDTPFQRRILSPNPTTSPGGGEVRGTALTQPPVHPTRSLLFCCPGQVWTWRCQKGPPLERRTLLTPPPGVQLLGLGDSLNPRVI